MRYTVLETNNLVEGIFFSGIGGGFSFICTHYGIFLPIEIIKISNL